MTKGIGYFDGTNYVFEGFSFQLTGRGGEIEFVPSHLIYPDLGDDPGQIVAVKVVVKANGFHGEQIDGFALPSLIAFQKELAAWDSEGTRGFSFVAGVNSRCLVDHPPWSSREWRVECHLANLENHNDPNSGTSASMEVFFMLGVSSVAAARRDLADFLRYLSTMERKQ